MTKNYKKIKVATLVVSIAAILGFEMIFKMVMPVFPDNRMLLLGLARMLQTGALVWVVLLMQGGLDTIGLERDTIYHGLKKGLLWSVGFGIAALGVLFLLSMAGIDVRSFLHTRLPDGQKNMLLFFLVGGIVAPVAEEVFFRGILYGFFRRWGFIIALVLSTGIFLSAHPQKGGFPLTQSVGGILFAVAYEAEGSLMVPVVIHMLGNLSIFTISLLL